MAQVSATIDIPASAASSKARKMFESGGYIEAVGRRKTAVARVRVTKGAKNTITVNGKAHKSYFGTSELQNVAKDAVTKSGIEEKFNITAVVRGGGIRAQAEAIRHGVTRALVDYEGELRKPLKKLGYLKRDPRSKERKKFGLKKARRAPQWSKR